MGNSGERGWTVQNLAESIKRGWSFPDDWFFWPPDVFAFTSVVFQRTGCYGLLLGRATEPTEQRSEDRKRNTVWGTWRRTPQWQVYVEEAAQAWLDGINRTLSGEKANNGSEISLRDVLQDTDLFVAAERLGELADKVSLEELRLSTGRPSVFSDARILCEDLVFLHAVADEACGGFGLPNAPPRDHALAYCLANLLLTTWGSLSAIPKYHGMVLPKMRTPRSGLTLRSLSHHVTFHDSEVEVMWRATPWINAQENTLNILCVPWPLEIGEGCFEPKPETFESTRYFSYAPRKSDDLSHLDVFVELARRASETVSRVHILVFPETALTTEEYRELMQRFGEAHQQKRLKHVPMIVAGVTSHNPEEGDLNEVRLAAYFAGHGTKFRSASTIGGRSIRTRFASMGCRDVCLPPGTGTRRPRSRSGA